MKTLALGAMLLLTGCVTYEVGPATRNAFAAQAQAGSRAGAPSQFTTQDVKALFGTTTPTGEKAAGVKIGDTKEKTPLTSDE